MFSIMKNLMSVSKNRADLTACGMSPSKHYCSSIYY